MSTITITEIGTIGTFNFPQSVFTDPAIDGIGIFGPAGASLVGQHFTVVFIGSDCNCSSGTTFNGSSSFGTGISPVQDAALTINGITYHSGPGYYGDMTVGTIQISQVNFVDGIISINVGGLGMGSGLFSISSHNAAGTVTSGIFIGESISNSLNVPGPVAGADLPGLLVAALLIFGGFYWKRRNTSWHQPPGHLTQTINAQ